jgi:hypothetical protein
VTEDDKAESRGCYHINYLTKEDAVLAAERLQEELAEQATQSELQAQIELETLRERLGTLRLLGIRPLTRADLARLSEEDIKTLKPKEKRRSSPPAVAVLFVSFLAPENAAQAMLGDFEEMYQKNVERLGEVEARRKYWIQVAASAWPLLRRWLTRIGFFAFLINYVRSKFGL